MNTILSMTIGAIITIILNYVKDFYMEDKKLKNEKDKINFNKKLEFKKLIYDIKIPLYKEIYNDFIEIYAVTYDARTLFSFGNEDSEKKIIEEINQTILNNISIIKKLMKYTPFVDKIQFLKQDLLDINIYLKLTSHFKNDCLNKDKNCHPNKERRESYYNEIPIFKDKLDSIKQKLYETINTDINDIQHFLID